MPTMSRRMARRAMRRDPIGFLCQCTEEHGPIVHLMLDRESFLLSDPKDISHVLVTDPLNFHKEHDGRARFRSIFGRSLPFLEGDDHRRVRQAIQPSFRPSSLSGVPKSVQAHAQQVTRVWPADGTVDVAGGIRRIAIGVAGDLILGAGSAAWSEDLFHAINRLHRHIVSQMRGPVAWPNMVWPWTRAWRGHRRAHRQLDAMMLEWIAHRSDQGTWSDDILSSVLRQRKSGELNLSDIEIRDHCVNLFLAATDPMTYAVSWSLYFLAEAPEVQARIARQADEILCDGCPTLDHVNALMHARRALSESLRLRPTTWMFEREPVTDATLPSGVVLPAGSRVMISPFVVHHRRELYPDPLSFNPDRFDPAEQRKRSPYAYLPFGAGPRSCIGQHLALYTGTLILALLLQKFRFRRIEGQSIPYVTCNGFTIQTSDGKMALRCQVRDKSRPGS